MIELARHLVGHGYHEIRLNRNAVGHFHTKGVLSGREVEVLVDTGASCTCVAMSLVKELGLKSTLHKVRAGSAGGDLDQFVVEGADFRLGGFVPSPISMAGLDFDIVNAPLVAQGSAAVDMILGSDVLDAHQAVIAYPTNSLFLKYA